MLLCEADSYLVVVLGGACGERKHDEMGRRKH